MKNIYGVEIRPGANVALSWHPSAAIFLVVKVDERSRAAEIRYDDEFGQAQGSSWHDIDGLLAPTEEQLKMTKKRSHNANRHTGAGISLP